MYNRSFRSGERCDSNHRFTSINISEPERYASAITGGFLLAYGLGNLNIWQRIAAVATGSGLIYRGISGNCLLYRTLNQVRQLLSNAEEEQIDEASEESFPASDPPAFSATSATPSQRHEDQKSPEANESR